MRTTLIINDSLITQIKTLSAKRRKTLSETVEILLKKGLQKETSKKESMLPLPSYKAGKCFVDVSDRDALYRILDRDRD